MVDSNSVIYMVCFVLFFSGLAFIYYMARVSQYNGTTENRTRRRIEDVAYYLSKLEEQLEDVEAQIHNKIDAHELDTRIKLTTYDHVATRISKNVEVKKKVAQR